MLSSLRTIAGRLARCDRGSIAPIAGVALMGVVLSAGFAIDYARAAASRSYLQSALDAAALAGARAIALGETDTTAIAATARAMFDANYRVPTTETVAAGDFVVTLDVKAKTVTIAATARMKTAFMSLAQVDQLDIGATSTTKVEGTKFEIAMMVDMTGSMADKPKGGSVAKIVSLKAAATQFVDTMLPASGATKDIVRIAIVPFAASVNAGSYAATVSGGKSASCVIQRSGSEADTDASPIGAPVGTSKSASCPSNQVRPLTNDRTVLLADVKAFTSSGTTAGHIGTQWARYVLSSKWASVWPSSAASAKGTKDLKKVAILMTDGLYNTSYDAAGNKVQVEPNAASTAAALAACEAMSKDGTIVYTIGFDLVGASGGWAKTILQDCASTITDASGKTRKAFYDVSDDAALKAAYAEIAAQLLRIRVSS